jgi:hypothetical protein
MPRSARRRVVPVHKDEEDVQVHVEQGHVQQGALLHPCHNANCDTNPATHDMDRASAAATSSDASQGWSYRHPLHLQRVSRACSASDAPPDMRLKDSRESDMQGMRHSRESGISSISTDTRAPTIHASPSHSAASPISRAQSAGSANSRAPTPEAICLGVESRIAPTPAYTAGFRAVFQSKT